MRERCEKCNGKGQHPNGHSTVVGAPVFEECYECLGLGWKPVGIVFDDWDGDWTDDPCAAAFRNEFGTESK